MEHRIRSAVRIVQEDRERSWFDGFDKLTTNGMNGTVRPERVEGRGVTIW